MTLEKPKDEDGVTLRDGDYITFTFGIPLICVVAQISEGSTDWGVNCLHPTDVKPKRTTLKELTKYYQIWKASPKHVSSITRDFGGQP